MADQLGRQLVGVSQELQAQDSTKADKVRGGGGGGFRQLVGVSQELQAQESTKADKVRGRGGVRRRRGGIRR